MHLICLPASKIRYAQDCTDAATCLLQNEKRQLETNLVVEQRIQNRETDKESVQSHSDDERDEDDVGSAVSNEDGSEDVFFECNTDLNRLSSRPLLTDETSTSETEQYYDQSQGNLADRCMHMCQLSSCNLMWAPFTLG